MTGINHALTGGLIVATISQPAIALPLAFLSHFALDSLPHFGEKIGYRNRLSKSVWMVDAFLVFIALCLFIYTKNYYVFAGALIAMSPDFVWVYRFVVNERLGKLPPQPMNKFNQFHESIQHFESRYGLIIELFWISIMLFLVLRIL